ncbi:uncharacterized protein LOC101736819 [Bombyx mori]|uniref:Peptidase S1 domain-containing protein n=1 Tax=Bombyx mori TaxID=7091 RepID=A0A8R2DP72_BOMMO|nr:uncharacterized protein LOC101736819 [Bombyx mori]
MGAGQIGGIATLLDIDFNNAAGFLGTPADPSEGQFVVHYLSHAMMFCIGSLIETNVVLTPASCVFGERYKFDVHAGTHNFIENTGISREAEHVCLHKGYNHTSRWVQCSTDNLAILVLNEHFSFQKRETGSDYVVNRVRYGTSAPRDQSRIGDTTCRYYGWGSRRNGYMLPLLLKLRRMDVEILPPEKCYQIWNYKEKYLCLRQPACKSTKYGALCPDDLGSLIECSGFAQGMMTSRLIDRPCGVGFIDLSLYNKFLTCAVDDSRDVINHDVSMAFEYTTNTRVTPSIATASVTNRTNKF